MTDVKFYKNNNLITGVVCKGHTGYAEYGKDIVCASISAIVGSACLGLTKVLGIKAKIKRKDVDGYIEIRLPKDISNENLLKAQIVFETMMVSLLDVQQGYPSNINVEV